MSELRKPSGLKAPAKIGRPCSSQNPKPAIPPSPPKSSSSESLIGLPRARRNPLDTSVVLTEDTDSFIIGDKVWVAGTKPGTIAFIGETHFGPQDWAGIVLDDPIGKNDGSVGNIRYFQCDPKRGIFCRLTRLTRAPLSEAGGDAPASLAISAARTVVAPNHTTSVRHSPTSPTAPRPPSSASNRDLKVGDRVIVKSSTGSKAGMLRYIGQTEFAPGDWCGVECDDPVGKNDGSVQGVRYFTCEDKFGLFAPMTKVILSPSPNRRPSCAVHPPGPSRQGTNDTITSFASSRISSTARKVNRPTTPSKASVTNNFAEAASVLKEKDIYIEQLLKERDLERLAVTRAASQAEDAERLLEIKKRELKQVQEIAESTQADLLHQIAELSREKRDLTIQLEDEHSKLDDINFRFEEESVARTELEANCATQKEKINQLEKILAEEAKKAEQLEQEANLHFVAQESLAGLRAELDEKEAHIQAGDSQIKQLSLKLEEISNECTKSKEAFVNEQNKCLSLTKSVEEHLNEISVKEKLIQNYNGTISKLESDINKLKEKLSNRELQLNDSESKNKKIELELKDIIKEFNKERNTLDEQIKLLSDKCKSLEDINCSKMSELQDLNNNFTHLQQELNLKDTKIQNYNGTISKLEFDINQLKENFSKMELQLNDRECKNHKLELEIKDIINEFDKERNTLKEQLNQLSDKCKSLEDTNNSKMSEFRELNNNSTHLQQELTVKEEEIVKLKESSDTKLKSLNSEITDLKNSIAGKINEFGFAEQQYKQEINQLKDNILDVTKSKDKTIETLQISIDQYNKQRIVFENNMKGKENEIIVLKKEHEEELIDLKKKIELQSQALATSESSDLQLINEIEDIKKQLKFSKKCTTETENKLKEEIRTLSESNKSLMLQLNGKEEQLQQVADSSALEIQKINLKLEKLAKEYEEVKRLFLNEQDKSLQFAKSVDKYENLLLEKDKLLENNKVKINRLESDLNNLNIKLSSYEVQVKCSEEKSTTLTREIEELKNQIDKEIGSSTEEVKLLSDKCKFLENENDKKTSELSQLNTCISDLKSQLTEKELELVKSVNYHNEKDKLLENNNKKISQLEYDLNNLNRNLSDTQLVAKQSEDKSAKLASELDELKNQIVKDKGSVTEELHLLSDKCRSLEGENVKYISELSYLKTCSTNLETKLAEKEDELTKLKESTKNEIGALKNEIINLTNEALSKSMDFESQEKTYKLEINNLKQDITDQMKDKVESLEMLQKVCDQQKSEISILESNIKDKENQIDALKNKYEDVIENLKSKFDLQSKALDASNCMNHKLEITIDTQKKELNVIKQNAVEAEVKLSQLTNIGSQRKLLSVCNEVDKPYKTNDDTEIADMKMQINFLNSIIADQQKKIESKDQEIQQLRDGSNGQSTTKDKNESPPRKYCEICEEFDLHESEDCPQQATYSPPPQRSKKAHKIVRPYCESCEVFGHDTANCEETY